VDAVTAIATVIAALAAVGVSGFVILRLQQAPRALPAPASPEPARVGAPDEPQPVILPDYVDDVFLTEVAEQLGVNTEPFDVEVGRADSESRTVRGTIGARLEAPGVGRVGGEAHAEEQSSHESRASLSVRRRPHFRAKIEAVQEELERREELITDLDVVPDRVLPEVAFEQLAYILEIEWDLVDIPSDAGGDGDATDVAQPDTPNDSTDAGEVTDAAQPDTPSAPASADAGADPGPPTALSQSTDPTNEFDPHDVLLAARLRELAWTAKGVTRTEIRRSLHARAKHAHHAFVRIRSTWHIHAGEAGPELGIAEFRTGQLLPRIAPRIVDVAAPSHEIWVPLSDSHLLTQGRQRMLPSKFVDATVFGRIERFDEDRLALVVLPIAVYSEDTPSSAAYRRAANGH
jgi:hypothetical protein